MVDRIAACDFSSDLSGGSMCVHNLVTAQALAAPHAIAIVGRDTRLTYGELEQRANQLANLLVSHGIGPERAVALFLERSPELAIAALAVLKAGGAYVPLDPGYPLKRISMLLQDSAASLVITHSAQAERLPAGKWQTIVLDSNDADRFPSAPPPDQSLPENLAYIIFTSGSTGNPKGVQVTRANLLNLVRWHQLAFSITSADRAMMQASPGFDASVWELWPYLATGATLHVVDDEVRTSPERLRDWMIASGISISFVPTAIAERLINLPWPVRTPLRTLLTGADTLRRYPPADLPFTLVNNYGPTECTVVATSGVVSSSHSHQSIPSIGSPIQNVRIHIVNEQMNAVPAGSPGELLIGGLGVARGYLNQPELTAQKFVADPFSGIHGARLYRTGDLARLLPNGEVAFLGRIDEQIKIRGYRIEPAEISTVLDQHPAIASSFVTAHPDATGEMRLLAYVVAKPEHTLNAGELRDFLAQQLPEYSLPSTFIAVSTMPFTIHGKIDRAALPTPTSENVLTDDSFEAPQSEIEQWLASFLPKLLGVERVSRNDNFFTLGGHSLMGAQLIATIDQTFGVELSLRSLFDHPTIREMSSEIESLIRAKLAAMTDDDAQRILSGLPDGIAV